MTLDGNFKFIFEMIDKVLNFSFPLFQFNISLYQILFFILFMSFISSLFMLNFDIKTDSYIEEKKKPTRDKKIRDNFMKRQRWIDEYKNSKNKEDKR